MSTLGDEFASGSSNATHSSLRRNQACHTCRKRKSKCDAKKPCGTCVRSYQHAKAHPQPGVVLPDAIDCTYDEVPAQSNDQYRRLENRIRELEALVAGQSRTPVQRHATWGETFGLGASLSDSTANAPFPIDESATSLISNNLPENTTTGDDGPDLLLMSSGQASTAPYFMGASSTSYTSPLPASLTEQSPSPSVPPSELHTFQEDLSSYASFSGAGSFNPGHSLGYFSRALDGTNVASHYPDNQHEVVFSTWPPGLPQPKMLNHLVQSFFAHHPHANRLFHQATFISNLNYPPTHPNFPSPAVLHAICAVGSQYTAEIVQTEIPGNEIVPNAIFQNMYRRPDHEDSFAETQIKLSRLAAMDDRSRGNRLLEELQSSLLFTHWNWSNGKWAEVFLSLGHVARSCGSLGLQHGEEFTPLSPSPFKPPQSRDAIEEETRRNIFWLAFTLDRFTNSYHSWAHSLQEEDCTQAFPVTALNFSMGLSWPLPEDRESLLQDDVVFRYDPETCDSFNIYLKAAILLGRVKEFNLRFRTKKFQMQSDYQPSSMWRTVWGAEHLIDGNYNYKDDPRCTHAFNERHQAIQQFQSSFPAHLRDPFTHGTIDSYLYAALCLPHIANIALHEAYAQFDKPHCRSAAVLLHSARSILKLLYAAESTSYDLSLLDPVCSLAWFLSGKMLVQFWKVGTQVDADNQASAFKTEAEFIVSSMSKTGQRLPLARGYSLVLSSIVSTAGGTMLQ